MDIDPTRFELVSIDGEMALLVRLGRRAADPVPTLGKVTRQFRISQPEVDSVGPFLADTTRCSVGARCRARPLYDAYSAFCEARASKRLSLVGFHRAMKARGFRQVISNGHWWRDLAMIDSAQGPLL